MSRPCVHVAWLCLVTVLLAPGVVPAAPLPSARCAASKNKAAGTRASCLAGETAKALLGSNSGPLQCEAAFARAFSKAEPFAARQGGTCPVSGDAGDIATRVQKAHDEIVGALLGTPLPECGDDVRNGTDQCDG